jgi:hypothetical protein
MKKSNEIILRYCYLCKVRGHDSSLDGAATRILVLIATLHRSLSTPIIMLSVVTKNVIECSGAVGVSPED